jgi:hypothetical protein
MGSFVYLMWGILKINRNKDVDRRACLSVVAVTFQSVFHLEMYQNNVFFLFFKNYF